MESLWEFQWENIKTFWYVSRWNSQGQGRHFFYFYYEDIASCHYKNCMYLENLALSYKRKCSRPIRFQDFLNYNISKTMWCIKLIFCMQLDVRWSHSLIVQFLLCVVRHVQACSKCSEIIKKQNLRKGMRYYITNLHVARYSWNL